MRITGYRSLVVAAAGGTLLWRFLYLADRVIPIPDQGVLLVGIAGLGIPLLGWLGGPGRSARIPALRQLAAPARSAIARAISFARRWAVPLSFAVVVAFVLLHGIRGPVWPCDPARDCHSYVRLVESLAFPEELLEERSRVWEGYGSHHAMRILPPLLVRGVMLFGLSIEAGFRVVSILALLGFGCGLLWVLLRASGSHLFAVGTTLLILGLDQKMVLALRDVYLSLEPLSFLIALVLIVGAAAGRQRLVGSVAILGVFVKQHLLALAGLVLLFLFVRARSARARLELVLWGVGVAVAYLALGAVYGGHETVVRHLLPTAGPVDLAAAFVTSGGLEPLIALVPLALIARDRLPEVAREYWFALAYCAVALGQPLMNLGFEGGQGGLVRLMLHGAWPLYLLAGIAIARKGPDLLTGCMLLALGAFFFDGQWSMERRMALAAAASLVILAIAAGRRWWPAARSG